MRALILLLLPAALLFAQETPAPPAAPPDVPTLIQTGKAAYLKGDYEAARIAFGGAWEQLQTMPPANPLRYDVLKLLASVRAAAGDFAGANDFIDMAINWRETTLGSSDPKISDDRLISVALLRGAKQFERALAVLGRVQNDHVRAFGPNDPRIADDFSLMAQINMDKKEPAAAESWLDVALRLRERLSGPLDPSLLADLDRIAGIQTMQREYDRAEASYQRALIIRETVYGRESAELLTALDGLAYARFGLKKYAEAEPVYLRLVALWRSSVGEDHPMMAVAYTKLAVFYSEQKKADQATEAYAHSNAVRAQFLAQGLAEAAVEQLGQEHKDAAIALYKRSLSALDPPDPLYDEARKQNETILKLLDPPPPPPKPVRKPAPAKKAGD
jgi:tetratricopeptide (TPR) repeat protein